MKRFAAGLFAAGMVAASLPAYSMDVVNTFRVGASAGRYSGDATVDVFDTDGQTLLFSGGAKGVGLTWGVPIGYTLTLGNFYGDLGLETLWVEQQDPTNRTDLLLTLGYYITDNWTVFAGLRRGWQGEGRRPFHQDDFNELGPYVGFGYGGIPLGKAVLLNIAAAYNFDRIRNFFQTEKDFDYPGVSLRLGLNMKGTPHSVQLRVQRFSGDDRFVFSDGSALNVELKEWWAVMSYVYSIGW